MVVCLGAGARCLGNKMTRRRAITPVAVAVLAAAVSSGAIAEESTTPSVVSLAIDATVTHDGRVVLRAKIKLGENASEEIDPTAFEINRTSHTGDSLWFPIPVEIEDGVNTGAISLDWTDNAVERGSVYRYYLEYFSSDASLASNVVSIYVPEMTPGGETTDGQAEQQRDELYVEIAGPEYAQKDKPFLVTARPSMGGGTVSWECITTEVGEVIHTQGRNAMLMGKSVTPGPIWRASYTLEDTTVHAYYRPYVIHIEIVGGFCRRPWEQGDAERLRRGMEREATRRRHVERMRAPDGVSELRALIRFAFLDEGTIPAGYLAEYLGRTRNIAQGVVKEVGEAAVSELHSAMRDAADVTQHTQLAQTIVDISEQYALSLLWPETLDREDVCVADLLSRHKYENAAPSEVRQMLVDQLECDTEYLRIVACRELARRKLVAAAPVLAKFSRSEESPLVRFWARHAVHCLERCVEPMRLHLPMSVSEIDERESRLARKVFAELRAGIGNDGGGMNMPGSARFRFRAFGSATVPIIGKRLCEPDCSELEMRIYGRVLRDVACGLPQRTREHFAQELSGTERDDRKRVFTRYKEVVRIVSEEHRGWRFLDLHKPYGRERVDRLLGGNEADRCYLVAGLSVCFDSLAEQKRPRARWVPFWASEKQKARLRKNDKLDAWLAARRSGREYCGKLSSVKDLAGKLAKEFLTPPTTDAPVQPE